MTITPNTTITQAGYHYILNTLKTVLTTAGTGYGVVPVSDYIGTGTLISAKPWENLYNDLNKAYVHQTGVSLAYPSNTFPTSGRVLSRNFVNTLTEAADSVAANKYTVAANQLTSVTTGSVSGTSTFTSVLTNTVLLQWSDEQSIDWYFNLGGKIITNLTAPVPVTVDTEHLLVVNLINNFTSTIAVPFDRTLWLATKTAPGRIYTTSSTTSTSTGPFTAYFTVSNTYQILDGDYSTTSTIKVNTEIIPTTVEALVPLFNLTATVTVTNYFSTGSIVAIRPQLTQTRDFDDFVASPNVRRTRTLTPLPSNLYYTMLGGSTSSVQTISITNSSIDPTSSVATITGITISSDVVTPYLSHSALPITLPVGSTANLSLYWDKPTVSAKELGEHYNSIIVQSNNTKGDLVLPVRVLVNEPPGNWNFSPASYSDILTTYRKLVQNVRIVPEFSTIRRIVGYSLSGGINFTLSKIPSAVDPTAVISYEPFQTDPGTYTGTFTVTVEVADTTGDYIQITKSFTFTVNQNIVDSNLGNWVSPVGAVNSVIGASYDIIGGQRYLTIGVGVGADGSPTVDEGGGTDRYANPGFLGVNSNSLIASNYIFSQYTDADSEYSKFGEFLKTYGVKSGQYYIKPTDTECSYDIDIPETGSYTISYSVYESGYVELDGNTVINLSAYDLNNYQVERSETLTLTAGTHSLRFVGNLRMALTVKNSVTGNLIWSTLNILQTGPSYKNWWEVYRFPINMDSVQRVMNSKDYRVKDTATARSTADSKLYPYGAFFGFSATDFGSMFRIISNGRGDLDIFMLPPIQQGKLGDTVTIGSLFFAFYYNQLSIPRYTHKTGGQYDGDSTYTDYFYGFNKFGDVKTRKVLIPRGFDYGSKKNSILDELITFFLSSLIVDFIVIELGLFTSSYLVGVTLSNGLIIGAYTSQSVSFGIYLLSKLGVDVGASQTVGGYITNYFSSFFQTSAAASGGAAPIAGTSEVLFKYAGIAQSAGAETAVLAQGVLTSEIGLGAGTLAEQIAINQALAADGALAVANPAYLGADAAAAAAVTETSSLATLASTPVGGFVVGAAGVVLAVAGVKYFIDGIKEGDPVKVVVGGAAAYGGYLLLEIAILGGACFTGNTLVELADGTVKPINEIKIGDIIKNAKGDADNQVMYIEKSLGSEFSTLYSPDENIQPFATLNHPLYIDGKLMAPDSRSYLWLDVKSLPYYYIDDNNDQEVYNLWVSGDHTYRVNNFGTTDIIQGGGALLNSINHGIVKDEEVFSILLDMTNDKPVNTYGAHLINQFLGKFNTTLVTGPLIYFACAPQGTLRKLTFKMASSIVGQIAKKIKRK